MRRSGAGTQAVNAMADQKKYRKQVKARMKERLAGEKFDQGHGPEQWALGARDKMLKAAGPVARNILHWVQ